MSDNKPTRDELIEHVETLVAKYAALSVERDGLREERDEARAGWEEHAAANQAWVEMSKRRRCICCGVEVEIPDDEALADQLQLAHVEICEQHPLFKARQQALGLLADNGRAQLRILELVAERDAAVEASKDEREACATIALEQRCERGTPWDAACVAIAAAIRSRNPAPAGTSCAVCNGESTIEASIAGPHPRDRWIVVSEKFSRMGVVSLNDALAREELDGIFVLASRLHDTPIAINVDAQEELKRTLAALVLDHGVWPNDCDALGPCPTCAARRALARAEWSSK